MPPPMNRPLKLPLGHLAKIQALIRTSLAIHFLPWSRAYQFVSSATRARDSTQELVQGGRGQAYVMPKQVLC